jgi:phenylalanyl-tRNA synthetase alpha subunit
MISEIVNELANELAKKHTVQQNELIETKIKETFNIELSEALKDISVTQDIDNHKLIYFKDELILEFMPLTFTQDGTKIEIETKYKNFI